MSLPSPRNDFQDNAFGETSPRKLFPKTCRLLKRWQFVEVERRGEKKRGKCFSVCLLKREDGPRRLGLIVSRKAGKAVVRNRIKRYIREFFRQHYQGLPEHTDIVVIAGRGAGFLDTPFLLDELQGLLMNGKWAVSRENISDHRSNSH